MTRRIDCVWGRVITPESCSISSLKLGPRLFSGSFLCSNVPASLALAGDRHGETRSFETSDFGSAYGSATGPGDRCSRYADLPDDLFRLRGRRSCGSSFQPRGLRTHIRDFKPDGRVLEERIAALEGGVGTLCTASGQAALHMGIATLMGAGGHILASSSLYGGTTNMFNTRCRDLVLRRLWLTARP